ncbi:MAG: hypothetical protein WD069_21680 [Planctomycetales bacterium]
MATLIESEAIARRRDELLVVKLRELAEFDPHITQREFCRRIHVPQSQIYQRFGGWNELRKLAGLPPRTGGTRKPRYEVGWLVEKFRETRTLYGDDLTMRDFQRHTGISPTAIRNHFGSWSALRKSQGLSELPKAKAHYTDEELMADLHRVAWTLRRFPKSAELARLSKFSLSLYARRFGNFDVLRALYGRYADALCRREIVENLQRANERSAGQ